MGIQTSITMDHPLQLANNSGFYQMPPIMPLPLNPNQQNVQPLYYNYGQNYHLINSIQPIYTSADHLPPSTFMQQVQTNEIVPQRKNRIPICDPVAKKEIDLMSIPRSQSSIAVPPIENISKNNATKPTAVRMSASERSTHQSQKFMLSSEVQVPEKRKHRIPICDPVAKKEIDVMSIPRRQSSQPIENISKNNATKPTSIRMSASERPYTTIDHPQQTTNTNIYQKTPEYFDNLWPLSDYWVKIEKKKTETNYENHSTNASKQRATANCSICNNSESSIQRKYNFHQLWEKCATKLSTKKIEKKVNFDIYQNLNLYNLYSLQQKKLKLNRAPEPHECKKVDAVLNDVQATVENKGKKSNRRKSNKDKQKLEKIVSTIEKDLPTTQLKVHCSICNDPESSIYRKYNFLQLWEKCATKLSTKKIEKKVNFNIYKNLKLYNLLQQQIRKLSTASELHECKKIDAVLNDVQATVEKSDEMINTEDQKPSDKIDVQLAGVDAIEIDKSDVLFTEIIQPISSKKEEILNLVPDDNVDGDIKEKPEELAEKHQSNENSVEKAMPRPMNINALPDTVLYKIQNTIKEQINYFESLTHMPKQYKCICVRELFNMICIESTEITKIQRINAGKLCANWLRNKQINVNQFIEGLTDVLDHLDDLIIHIPMIITYISELLCPILYDGILTMSYLESATRSVQKSFLTNNFLSTFIDYLIIKLPLPIQQKITIKHIWIELPTIAEKEQYLNYLRNQNNIF